MVGAYISIWSGQISPMRSYPERKLVCMSVPRAAQIISGSSSSFVHRHRIGGNRLSVVNERMQDVSKSAIMS